MTCIHPIGFRLQSTQQSCVINDEEEMIEINNERTDSPQKDYEKTLALRKVKTHTTTKPPAPDLISTSVGDSLRGEDKKWQQEPLS